jgi:hypothetical protein
MMRVLALAPIWAMGCLAAHHDEPGLSERVAEAAQALCDTTNGYQEYDEFIPLVDPNTYRATSGTWVSLADLVGDGGPIPTDITSLLEDVFRADTLTGLPATAPVGGHAVLYIPPGTYEIKRTIKLFNASGVTLVGDDPTTTTIRWNPEAGDTEMFQVIDTGYAKISRLTLDGNSRAKVIFHVLQSTCYNDWKYNNGDQSSYATKCHLPIPNAQAPKGQALNNVEFDDDVLLNADFGIVGDGGRTADLGLDATVPAANSNQSYLVIRRSRFDSIGNSAIEIGEQNALAWLIADSAFSWCGNSAAVTAGWAASAIAVHQSGGGSFSAINNAFAYNNRDFYVGGEGANVIRGNYSKGSNAFLWHISGEADVSGNYIELSGAAVAGPGANECWAAQYPAPYGLCIQGRAAVLDNFISFPTSNAVAMYLRYNQAQLMDGFNVVTPGVTYATNWSGDQILPPKFGLSDLQDPHGTTPGTAAAIARNGVCWDWDAATSSFAQRASGWCAKPARSARTASSHLLAMNNAGALSTSTGQRYIVHAAALNTQLMTWKAAGGQYAVYFPAFTYYRPGTPPVPTLGEYEVDGQIDVPEGLDVTFMGDGTYSHLYWNGTADNVFHFRGSSTGRIRP